MAFAIGFFLFSDSKNIANELAVRSNHQILQILCETVIVFLDKVLNMVGHLGKKVVSIAGQ